MQELITVIVPVYNAEKYLGRCIKSILNQTYKNFELILVNDGSEDCSLEICYQYASQDSRIQVLSKENGGASAARNAGLHVRNGRYLVFVDSDDYISPNYLLNLYRAVKLDDYDIVQCDYEITHDGERASLAEVFSTAHVSEITKIQALNERVYKVSLWGKIYSSRLFEGFQFEEGIIYEDDASYYKLVYTAHKIAVIKEKLYFYYMSDNSVMRNSQRDKSLDFIKIYEDRISYFFEKGERQLLDGTHARYCLVILLFLSCAKNNKHNVSDWDRLWDIYKEQYKKIWNSRYVNLSDKIMLATFRILPNLSGSIISRLR